ncbi:MAG TPA: DUF4232 domain-containing protein [Jatrophihabitantaceae bacterium]|nr:DUF4232 domain-containing protein [Jatrophihabitantaceae bacterium]
MRRSAWLIVALPLTLAAACTSSKTQSHPTPSAPATTSAPSSSSSPSTDVDTGVEESLTPTPSASTTPAGPPTCLAKNVRVDVLPGSGAAGRQFASISFANTGPATCAMSGAPQVTLLRAGTVLGKPAVASAKPAQVVLLAPGKAADTTLTGFSTCNAKNSDAVRIAPPGQPQTVDMPLELRGCSLQVDPVSAMTG